MNAPAIETLLAQAPRAIRRNFRAWQAAVAALDAAPVGGKLAVARKFGRRLGVAPATLFTRRSEFRKRGDTALLDKRFIAARNRRTPAKASSDTVRARRQRNIISQLVLRQYKSGIWRVVKQSRFPA